VGPFPTEDGYVIELPYGTRSDWLKNVVASGSAAIVHDGGAFEVDRPEILPIAEAVPYLPAHEVRRAHRFGVDQCLRLRRRGGRGPNRDPYP